jgi:hypothetical protein
MLILTPVFLQITNWGEALGLKRDNAFIYNTFRAGIAAGYQYTLEEGLAVVNASWKAP